MALMSVVQITSAVLWPNPADWRMLSLAGQRAGTDALYDPAILFRYSPLYAWLLVPLMTIGPLWWAALHVPAALAFGNWRVSAIVLISWPFWFDALSGNVLIFVVLIAWWALRGNRIAGVVYIALCLLMPRPLMAPLAVWLLWKRSEMRLPALAVTAVWTVGTLATGLTDEWLRALPTAGAMFDHFWNVGPSRWLGVAWVSVGFTLAAWLTWKGRLGLASLAATPYVLPYYLLFGILELVVAWSLPLSRPARHAVPRTAGQAPTLPASGRTRSHPSL